MSLIAKHILAPTTFFFAGLSVLANATAHGFNLWSASRQAGPLTSRRDIAHINRLKHDYMLIGPAVLFMVLPFTIPMIPFIIHRFPGVVPVVFITPAMAEKKRIALTTRRTKKYSAAILESLANDLLRVKLDPMPSSKARNEAASKEKLAKILSAKFTVTNQTLVDLYPFIYSHFDITMVSVSTLVQLNRYLGDTFPRYDPVVRCVKWADWIMKDDVLIAASPSGAESLNECESVEAYTYRGFSDLNVSESEMIRKLDDHGKFSRDVQRAAVAFKNKSAKSNAAVDFKNKSAKSSGLTIAGDIGLETRDILAVAVLLIIRRLTVDGIKK